MKTKQIQETANSYDPDHYPVLFQSFWPRSILEGFTATGLAQQLSRDIGDTTLEAWVLEPWEVAFPRALNLWTEKQHSLTYAAFAFGFLWSFFIRVLIS